MNTITANLKNQDCFILEKFFSDSVNVKQSKSEIEMTDFHNVIVESDSDNNSIKTNETYNVEQETKWKKNKQETETSIESEVEMKPIKVIGIKKLKRKPKINEFESTTETEEEQSNDIKVKQCHWKQQRTNQQQSKKQNQHWQTWENEKGIYIENEVEEINKQTKIKDCQVKKQTKRTKRLEDLEDIVKTNETDEERLKSLETSSIVEEKPLHTNEVENQIKKDYYLSIFIHKLDKLQMNISILNPQVKVQLMEIIEKESTKIKTNESAIKRKIKLRNKTNDEEIILKDNDITQPFVLPTHQTMIPIWNEVLFLPCETKSHYLIFEVLENKTLLAWAFLKLSSMILERKLRLQLFYPGKKQLIDFWKNGKRKKYPSTLHIQIFKHETNNKSQNMEINQQKTDEMNEKQIICEKLKNNHYICENMEENYPIVKKLEIILNKMEQILSNFQK